MARVRRKGTGFGIIAFVVLCICLTVAYGKAGLEKQLNSNNKKLDELDLKIQEQVERKTSIKNLEAYVKTKRYIEEIAREKLGLVYEYEIIFEKEEEE
jgi:cell division protein DivIC